MTELQVSIEGSVASLQLHRPAARNALSPSLLEALVQTCQTLQTNDAVRVVVLRGAAGVFSAGADLMGFMEMLQREEAEALAMADIGRLAAEALEHLPQITIAAIEGHCVGGGVVLAGACDLRWAAPGSWFSVPELALGVPLGWGGMRRLVALVGESRAAELVLVCERFTVEEALQYGFVSTLLEAPAGSTWDEALAARVALVASRPAGALRTTKGQLKAIRAGHFGGQSDAAALLKALRDPESQQAAQDYMMQRLGAK